MFMRWPVVAAFALGVTIFVWLLFATRFGIAITAVHDDERAAELMGLNVRAFQVAAFTLGSIIAGNGINFPILVLAYYRARPASEARPAAVLTAARFIRENRTLLFGLARDLLGGNPEVMGFARKNFPRHVFLIIRLIRDCQKAGDIQPLPLVQVLPFLFASVVGPVFAIGFIGEVMPAGLKGLSGAVLKQALASYRFVWEQIRQLDAEVEQGLNAMVEHAGRSAVALPAANLSTCYYLALMDYATLAASMCCRCAGDYSKACLLWWDC
jgi:hypothetical protein